MKFQNGVQKYNKPMKSDSQRYHIGCKRKGATNCASIAHSLWERWCVKLSLIHLAG